MTNLFHSSLITSLLFGALAHAGPIVPADANSFVVNNVQDPITLTLSGGDLANPETVTSGLQTGFFQDSSGNNIGDFNGICIYLQGTTNFGAVNLISGVEDVDQYLKSVVSNASIVNEVNYILYGSKLTDLGYQYKQALVWQAIDGVNVSSTNSMDQAILDSNWADVVKNGAGYSGGDNGCQAVTTFNAQNYAMTGCQSQAVPEPATIGIATVGGVTVLWIAKGKAAFSRLAPVASKIGPKLLNIGKIGLKFLGRP